MEEPQPAREATARRRVELEQRIQELHRRNHELADILTRASTSERQGASPRNQAARAEELARLASGRAAESTQRAAQMYLHSATAHERAARMHTLLADQGIGNVGEHRGRAADHLRLAAEDRSAAGRIADGHQPPAHGQVAEDEAQNQNYSVGQKAVSRNYSVGQ